MKRESKIFFYQNDINLLQWETRDNFTRREEKLDKHYIKNNKEIR